MKSIHLKLSLRLPVWSCCRVTRWPRPPRRIDAGNDHGVDQLLGHGTADGFGNYSQTTATDTVATRR